jgi:hypothetical protein
MKKKSITILGIFIFAMFLFSSCQTKEERVINKFKDLAERVDKNSDTFSDQDWEEVLDEYEALNDEAMDCEFTNEQLREFGRVDGLLTGVITREGSKKLGRDLGRYINEGKQVMKGFLEGFSEGISSEKE